MTSTDTSGHPDVSEISDLTEGLLPSARADEVREHMDECEPCDNVRVSLIEIRELLGTVPAPQRMPDDVADRIDAALAAAALDTTVSGPSAHVSRETRPAAATRPDKENSAQDRPAGRPGAATGPGRRPTRHRRRSTVLGAALGTAVIGLGILLLQNDQTSQDTAATKSANRSSDSTPSETSAFSESTLEGSVRTLLRHADRRPSAPDGIDAEQQPPSVMAESPPGNAPSASEAPQTPLRTSATSVPVCIQQGIGRDTPALAVEAGTYEGTDAFLVVLPHRSEPTRVQAYVVDAACTQDKGATKGKLLLTHTYARP
ncbi:zf-HC2 domain-containing protein [Streptomyces sp. NPDC032161]|uniref:zf-HC2 domain-containing protein n=1 Tax=unclassified Streptomyces TaxID=2593676 RepID=UPI0033E26E27